MRALLVKELAHPARIPVVPNVPEPVPGRGQILVDVYSAGLNFFDVTPFLSATQTNTTVLNGFYNTTF
jgi:NADPH2:quinone reductase